MIPPDEFGQMPTGDYTRIEELGEKLVQAWKAYDGSGEGVDLEPFLSTCGSGLRLPVLYELIKTEMPFRFQNGLLWDLDYYLEKYPELGDTHSLTPNLILEECLVRKQHNMRISVASYKRRFPQQFQKDPALEKRLEKESATDKQVNSPAPSPAVSAAGPATSDPFNREIVPGKVIAEHFVVQGILGDGGYGKVYKVLDTRGNIEKALKIISHPLDTEAARTELDALERIKNLQHLLILRPESFWVERDRGQLVILMELASGGSLRDCMKRHQKEGKAGIPVQELLGYVRDAADALDYLHDQKIVHRDIKPENILLVGNHAMIADMGVAKLLHHGRTTTAPPLGSLPYMAPEVLRNSISRRSDQYSLVVTYAELRQGKRVFKGKSWADFYEAHTSGKPLLDQKIPTAEQEVILKGLAKEPAARYLSCLEFVDALRQAMPRKKRRRKPEPVGAPTIALDAPPDASNATPAGNSPADTGHLDSRHPPGEATPRPESLPASDAGNRDNPNVTVTPHDTDSSRDQRQFMKPAAVEKKHAAPSARDRSAPKADTDSRFPPAPTPHRLPGNAGIGIDMSPDESDQFRTIAPGAPGTAPTALPHDVKTGKHGASAAPASARTSTFQERSPTVVRPSESRGMSGKVIIALGGLIGLVAALVLLVIVPLFRPAKTTEVVQKINAGNDDRKPDPPPVVPKKPEVTENEVNREGWKPTTTDVKSSTDIKTASVEIAVDPVLAELKNLNESIGDHIRQRLPRDVFQKDLKSLLAYRTKTGPPERNEAFYQALSNLATQYVVGNANFKREDLALLEGGRDHEVVKNVFPQAMAKYVETLVPTWPKEDQEWTSRLVDCDKADKTNAWVKACRQECLVEAPELLVGRNEERSSEAYLANVGTDDPAYAYSAYVLAVSKARSGANRRAAADLLVPLDPRQEKCFVDERRSRAADILQKAGLSLRDDQELFYKDAATANDAFRYLVGAGKWLDANSAPTAIFPRELSVAALTKHQPDWTMGLDLAKKSLTGSQNLVKKERQFFELVTADSYEAIRRQLLQSRGPADKTIALADWKAVIDPALTLVKDENGKTNPMVALRRARWLAAKGWLMRIHPNETWAADRDPKKEANEAYNEACSVADQFPNVFSSKEEAEFLAGKIFSAAYQADPEHLNAENWGPLKKLAEDAVRLDSNNPNCHAALAYVLLHQARLERKLEQRLAKYMAAYRSVKTACQLIGPGKDEDEANIYFLRSNICLQLGNIIHLDQYVNREKQSEDHKKTLDEEAKGFFRDAHASAKRIVDAELAFPPPAKVWLAYGYALEDLELFKVEPRETNYQQAIDALKNGWELAGKTKLDGESITQATFALAIGRCYYRWAEITRLKLATAPKKYKEQLDEYVKQGQKNIETSAPAGTGPGGERAEASYWLGKCLLIADDDPEKKAAKNKFEESMREAEKADLVNTVIMAKAELYDLEIKEVVKFLKKEKFTEVQNHCRSAAETLLGREAVFETKMRGDYLYDACANERIPQLFYYRGSAFFNLSAKKSDAASQKALQECDASLGRLKNENVAVSKFHLLLFDLKRKLMVADYDKDYSFGKQRFAKDDLNGVREMLQEAIDLGAWAARNPNQVKSYLNTPFLSSCRILKGKLEGSPNARDLTDELASLNKVLEKLGANMK